MGCLVATLTLSVSVALTVLGAAGREGLREARRGHPVHHGREHHDARRHVGRGDAATTPVAAQIVLAEAIGVTIVSLIILAFFFQPVKRTVIGLDDWLVSSNLRLAVFVGVLFILPITFLLSGLVYTPGG